MCRRSPTQPRGSSPSHFRACLSDCCGCSSGVGTHWIRSLFVLLCLVALARLVAVVGCVWPLLVLAGCLVSLVVWPVWRSSVHGESGQSATSGVAGCLVTLAVLVCLVVQCLW
jgi:hypothetical protein